MPESQFDPATQVSKVCRYVKHALPKGLLKFAQFVLQTLFNRGNLFLNGIVRLVLTLAGHQQIQFCEIKSQNT